MRTHPNRLTAGLLAALGFLAATGPFATDMYLASFTSITRDLGATPASVQLTLTAFLAGIGIGQLLLGPLSDAWGRRRVLLIALSVFAAAGVALVFTPNIWYFIAFRLLQGLTGAAGVVIARAIAVDLSTGPTAVRALSLIATVSALGPLIAPPLGGLVATHGGWRVVLATLAAVSIAMLVVTALVVPESLPREKRHTGRVFAVFRAFGPLLRDLPFTGFILAFAFGFATMMAYISASPFVGQIVLGMSPFVYSLAFAAGATALITANLVNARIAPRFGPHRMLRVGVALCVTAATCLTLLTVTGILAPWSLIVCAFLATGGAGLTMSNGSALALSRTTHATRGTGAALLGATQFLFGASVTPIVGLWGEHTALPLAVTMLVTSVAASVLAVLATRASRRAPRERDPVASRHAS